MSAESYERAAELTYRLVRGWKGETLRFAFPPKEIGLIADLRDIGQRLARNDSARQMVALLVNRCLERHGEAPTAMMLRVALECAGLPIETASLSELGIEVATS